MSDISTHLTVQAAQEILATFNRSDIPPPEAVADKALLRQALLLVSSLSDYQLLGICAGTANQGYLALQTYTSALGYAVSIEKSSISGPIYIKFNSLTGGCYASPHLGKSCGVLVACQSAQAESINEMYGPLPLDLFSSL